MTTAGGSSRMAGAQQTFRALLTAMARPGTVQTLPLLPGEQPEISLLFALADHEVTFALVGESAKRSHDMHALARQIGTLTGSTPSAVAEADFVVSYGPLPAGAWPKLRRGTPAFPDRSATIVYILPAIGLRLLDTPATALTLTGPGIETDQRLVVSGLNASEFTILAEANADFPLGVDAILTDPLGRMACIPRSSKIEALPISPGRNA